MNIVHSFSAANCSDKMFKIHMIYFILSCIYAKENGFNIRLHADKRTSNLLQIAPYDEIITDIPDVSPNKPRIYAWSKFYAMKNEDLGNIHIDGDVFLKDKKLIDLLDFSDYDCIVQNIEEPKNNWGFLWKESTECFKNCKYPYFANRECKSMYNCGIIGINNQELKDIYFDTYENMCQQYNINGIDCNSVPDIIIEQQFLKDLIDFKNYNVKTILDFDNLSMADSIGYQHVIGCSKEPNLNTVIKLIKKHNTTVFNDVNKYLLNK